MQMHNFYVMAWKFSFVTEHILHEAIIRVPKRVGKSSEIPPNYRIAMRRM